MRFRESPEKRRKSRNAPGAEDKILHSTFRIGDNTLSASDGQCLGRATHEGFSLSLNVPDRAAAERVFQALSTDGGQVRMPLAPTFFSLLFGTVVDRFGIPWIINAVS